MLVDETHVVHDQQTLAVIFEHKLGPPKIRWNFRIHEGGIMVLIRARVTRGLHTRVANFEKWIIFDFYLHGPLILKIHAGVADALQNGTGLDPIRD